MPTVMANNTANGGTTPFAWDGGSGEIQVFGTFDGATVQLQFKDAAGNWVNEATHTAQTAAGTGTFTTPVAMMRANVTGGGESTQDLSAVARKDVREFR